MLVCNVDKGLSVSATARALALDGSVRTRGAIRRFLLAIGDRTLLDIVMKLDLNLIPQLGRTMLQQEGVIATRRKCPLDCASVLLLIDHHVSDVPDVRCAHRS